MIVETARGVEYGFVVLGNRRVEDGKVVQPLKQVMRMARAEDEPGSREIRKRKKKPLRSVRKKSASTVWK